MLIGFMSYWFVTRMSIFIIYFSIPHRERDIESGEIVRGFCESALPSLFHLPARERERIYKKGRSSIGGLKLGKKAGDGPKWWCHESDSSAARRGETGVSCVINGKPSSVLWDCSSSFYTRCFAVSAPSPDNFGDKLKIPDPAASTPAREWGK
jgi:hypothetical protein